MTLGRPLIVAIPILLIGGVLASPLRAQPQDREARINVKVIADRLIATCRVSSAAASIPVNLLIAYDRLCGLELHNKATDALKVESPDGRTRPITINFPGMDLKVDRRAHGDEDELDAFTRLIARSWKRSPSSERSAARSSPTTSSNSISQAV